MSPAELFARFKERAAEECFDLVGVAASARLDRDARALEAWLAEGMHASMLWMSRDPAKRGDPGELLPGCCSVVVLATNYRPDEFGITPDGSGGKVARYAWGRDYHKILGRGLKRLSVWLEEETGLPARSFVDTAPILERAWAERAGLGWIGKNANLISRELGSWLLVGEILTAAELEPDTGPHQEFCGTCTACIEACPTEAIVADGVVDARRCIAYWNIEHRGAVPAERRPGIGDWIFGCDVCQEVCPWNHRERPGAPDEPLERRADLAALDPERILAMDETEFRARYSGSSLMRARWDGMRRNACLVLGNQRRPGSAPSLARALGDEDPVVRGHAAWALGQIGGPVARQALCGAARTEGAGEVRREIEDALAASGPSPEPK